MTLSLTLYNNLKQGLTELGGKTKAGMYVINTYKVGQGKDGWEQLTKHKGRNWECRLYVTGREKWGALSNFVAKDVYSLRLGGGGWYL